MPTDFIHHDKLFDLLERVGALIREVSTLVHDLEEKSRNKESTNETSHAALDLLKNIELLKEDLKYVYLKALGSSQCCFPMNDGPLFMHLLLIHLNDLLDSNSYSIGLIKDDIRLVKEALEFIRSFFVNVEQGLYKDLWEHVLDVAYEAKDVIDAVIVRDSGLLHLIFSLPITRKKVKLIREEVSNLPEKIPKNKSLIVINSTKKPVENKSLTTEVAGETFNQVTGSDLKFNEDIDVADKLRKQLFGKRYLIVLDDVWDTTTWDELSRPFPKVEKGSRIILTTREKKVAFHGRGTTDPLNLRLLRPDESWELLKKRAFGKESCPDELLDVGKEIVQNCKGLPLVVDLIAGVIAGREKKKTVWLEVRNNLNSFILSSEVDVMKSLGEVMEIYLDNSISSSLVIAFNEIDDNPTFQLHDVVHDFCLIKAREEKLFGEISSSDASSSSDLMPQIVNIVYNKEQFELNNFVLFSSKKKRHSDKQLYSLVITGDEMEDRLSDACHLRDSRLLRVLILSDSFMKVKDSLLNEICMLNHLRCLRIGTEVKSLPSSFSNLWNLESLWVVNKGSTLVLLPSIWDLAKLRVLYMTSCSFLNTDTDEPILIAEHSKLENLRYLRALVLSYSKETEDIFIRFPNLQSLVFDLKESWDYSKEQHWFPKLDHLTELDYLRADFESSNTNEDGPSLAKNWSWDFHFPSNLKKLSLWDFPLTPDSLSIIARLANLEELFLRRIIIQEEEWTFVNLKYLNLERNPFPCLRNYPQLEDSALEIKQYVEDMMGEDKLQILGQNNIPLSKTDPENLKGWEGEVTLNPLAAAPSSSAMVSSHPSWSAVAMPRTASLLPPNAQKFNFLTHSHKIYNVMLHTLPLVMLSQVSIHLVGTRMYGVLGIMSLDQSGGNQVTHPRYTQLTFDS
ncbi:putative lysine-specific demethylase JMJ14-like [Capsicum annuum]|nr:putative lysine-specific demethylase JMJ14-like [Capsicum annuum]